MLKPNIEHQVYYAYYSSNYYECLALKLYTPLLTFVDQRYAWKGRVEDLVNPAQHHVKLPIRCQNKGLSINEDMKDSKERSMD